MRRVLLALIGIAAAEIAQAETYSFTTVVNKSWWYQTLIHCAGPATGRAPQGCILSEPAIADPNLKIVRNQPAWPVPPVTRSSSIRMARLSIASSTASSTLS